MGKNIEWHTERRKLNELIPDKSNPRTLSHHDGKHLAKSLEKFNLASIPVVDTSNNILAGHQRIDILKRQKGVEYEIDVRVPNRDLSDEEITEYRLRDNRNTGEFNYDVLANNFDVDYLESVGFKDSELVGFELDDFESEFYSYSDDNAEMPIVPKFSEKYSSVVILCDNELDENWLKNIFKIDSEQCYKTSRVAPNYVIPVKRLQEFLDKI